MHVSVVFVFLAVHAGCHLGAVGAVGSVTASSRSADHLTIQAMKPGEAAVQHRQLMQVKFGINFTQVEEGLSTCSNIQELNSSYYVDYLPVCKLAPDSTCGNIPSSIYPYGACCPSAANLTSGADCTFQSLPYDPYFKCAANQRRVCCQSFYCARYYVPTAAPETTCPSDVPDGFCCSSTSSLSTCTGSSNGTTASCKRSGSTYLRCCPKGVFGVIAATTAQFPSAVQGNTSATPQDIAAFKSCSKK